MENDPPAHTGHAHGVEISSAIHRRLLVVVAPFAVATLVGLVLLWPSGGSLQASLAGPPAERFEAAVTAVTPEDCGEIARGPGFRCFRVEAQLGAGPDSGEVVSFRFAGGEGVRVFSTGDRILLSPPPEGSQGDYLFVDYQRSRPLLLLAVLFVAVVVALSRWRGVTAIAGLALSISVLVWFVLPAILEGQSPLLVAIVGAAAIMFASLYLAHGFDARTTTALMGTLVSLALTALLALLFVEVSKFTGLSSEEATFLQISAGQINLEGLLLGGVIIGALGVLDDVTVTQASAVWELRLASPEYGAGDLYRSALRIGRDHIASTVNTLVLAYAGASLPLLILFTLSEQPVGNLLTSEVIAEEIVRTLVGSIGLVSSVPITTALAAFAATAQPVSKVPTRPHRG